jgi:hypothetical protein
LMTDPNYILRHNRNEARASSLIFSRIRQEILVYPSINPFALQKALESLYFLILASEYETVWELYLEPILGRKATEEEKTTWAMIIRNYLVGYLANRVVEIVASITYIMNKPEVLAQEERTERIRLALDEIKPRANSYARTDTTRAMMLVKLAVLSSSPFPWEKKWVANRDERTREAHRIAGEGKFISVSDFFIVGGETLLFPADDQNGASFGNVINCRCGLDFRIRR